VSHGASLNGAHRSTWNCYLILERVNVSDTWFSFHSSLFRLYSKQLAFSMFIKRIILSGIYVEGANQDSRARRFVWSYRIFEIHRTSDLQLHAYRLLHVEFLTFDTFICVFSLVENETPACVRTKSFTRTDTNLFVMRSFDSSSSPHATFATACIREKKMRLTHTHCE